MLKLRLQFSKSLMNFNFLSQPILIPDTKGLVFPQVNYFFLQKVILRRKSIKLKKKSIKFLKPSAAKNLESKHEKRKKMIRLSEMERLCIS